jgi:hypothetical protein
MIDAFCMSTDARSISPHTKSIPPRSSSGGIGRTRIWQRKESDRLTEMDSVKPTPKAPKEKKLWFRAKTYGYGWYPANWRGWAVIVVYLGAVLIAAWDILGGGEAGVVAVKRFLVTVFILSFFLVMTCYKHGEKLKWQWGKNTKEHENDRA